MLVADCVRAKLSPPKTSCVARGAGCNARHRPASLLSDENCHLELWLLLQLNSLLRVPYVLLDPEISLCVQALRASSEEAVSAKVAAAWQGAAVRMTS